ncbi:MAG: PEP-CTERM/exosortase system-associated acyltransferase [Ectothiorhodospiraceae bacterium]|nr:PEP-CTERM/exosortase system-associated acyltransferase [Ectothiorhodospiraceae bacterium]MCH8502726.1 PEP-CTERM/exosortase system-associated acyltransferase [Ectothiorhodospiraceae bacterium]
MSQEPQTDALARFFEFQHAWSEEQRNLVHRIRYAVYCQEFRFEREEDCPGGMERDDYDDDSRHCLLIHRQTGTPAGCVRVIEPGRGSDHKLALERFCGTSLEHPTLHPARFPRDTVCEVSRLAVPAFFRRRQGENLTPYGNVEELRVSDAETRTFPLIGMAMFLAATALVGLANRPHVFAMMEPRLARLLSRAGLNFVQVGRMINYHGPRAAFYIHQHEAVDALQPPLKRLYATILQQLTSPPGEPMAKTGSDG